MHASKCPPPIFRCRQPTGCFTLWEESQSNLFTSSPERRDPYPERSVRRNKVYGKPVGNTHTVHGNTSPIRPKSILVILSGRAPYQKVNMVVNKRTVLSMDQLISDISKSLGRPKWRNDRVVKLYTIRGDEITDPSDIFNECDVFVAVPAGGRINGAEMSSIIEGSGLVVLLSLFTAPNRVISRDAFSTKNHEGASRGQAPATATATATAAGPSSRQETAQQTARVGSTSPR